MWDVNASREFYTAIGIDTIPLVAGSKRPISDSWPTKPSAEQWRNASAGANLGIRHRGDVVNIEADTKKVPETHERVAQGLTGLGVTNPVVIKSASGIGRHVYVRCPDAPTDVAYRNLAPQIGAGELRIGIGAMSVLPDSRVAGARYELLSGDWRSIPVVQWRDLLWLLPLQRVITHADSLPIRLNWRPMSQRLSDLFDATARAGRGEAVGQYPSRSEAEAAIVSASILNGWSFDDVRAEFRHRNVGHYHDAKRHADRYLETSYSNALATIMSSRVRQFLAVMYQDAEARPWPGKAGISNRAAFLAVLAECYRAGVFEASISVREVSEHAAISVETSRCALKRLTTDGLIKHVCAAAPDGKIASVYRVDADNLTGITDVDMSDYRHSPAVTSVRLSTPSELASRVTLGQSAVQVYGHLDAFNAQSAKQLAVVTGRARSTVSLALDHLADHGLAAQTDSGGWILGPNDLATVAQEFDCDGLAAARRSKYEMQRAAYQRVVADRLERGKKKYELVTTCTGQTIAS
jgi:predicted transcriptional regulator